MTNSKGWGGGGVSEHLFTSTEKMKNTRIAWVTIESKMNEKEFKQV